LARFEFPRQKSGRQLCIADFLRHENSGEDDILAAQVVTMGENAAAVGKSAFENEKYSEYFYFHALSTELAEACAEMMHKEIRALWGIGNRDSVSMREIFSQGYQGSRYSFGYPACPDLAASPQLLKLLGADRIGISLTESFQMVPEQSTSALVLWHPQARYFSAL
jgi:5-methyltetrahydrofolate--homocysteine methyltransferase